MEIKLSYLVQLIDQIKDKEYLLPPEITEHPTGTGIPLYYTKGITAGRQEAIELIENLINPYFKEY